MEAQTLPEPLTYEEEREQRRRRFLFIGLPLLAVLLAGLAFAARPAVHAVKGWQARRLAAESLALTDAGQLAAAADKARDAFQIYRAEPAAWRALGRLLTRVGQGRTALPWWQKLARAGLLTVEDRRDWVAAALAADAPVEARAQLDWLLARPGGGAPGDRLLAAREASWHRDFARAARFDEDVLADARATGRERFNAAVQILYLAPAEGAAVQAAVALVTQTARASADPLALDALTLLAWRAVQNPGTPAPLPPGELAALLEAQPRAGDYHRLLALEARAVADPAREDALMAEAEARFAKSDDDAAAAALLQWFFRRGRYTGVLNAVTPARAAGSRELVRPYLDSLGALGRYGEARELLADPRLALDLMTARMYGAVVREHLGEKAGAAGEWDRALDAAGKNPDQLLALGQFAASQNNPGVAETAEAAALALAPERRPVYFALHQLALQKGQTARAHEVIAEAVRRWPDDRAARAEETYLRLLLDPGTAEAGAVEEEITARPAPAAADWPARINLALARLRRGRAAAARGVFAGSERGDQPGGALTGDAPARARVVHAAALRAGGQAEAAAAEARVLGGTPLLPEERTLLTGAEEEQRIKAQDSSQSKEARKIQSGSEAE